MLLYAFKSCCDLTHTHTDGVAERKTRGKIVKRERGLEKELHDRLTDRMKQTNTGTKTVQREDGQKEGENNRSKEQKDRRQKQEIQTETSKQVTNK